METAVSGFPLEIEQNDRGRENDEGSGSDDPLPAPDKTSDLLYPKYVKQCGSAESHKGSAAQSRRKQHDANDGREPGQQWQCIMFQRLILPVS